MHLGGVDDEDTSSVANPNEDPDTPLFRPFLLCPPTYTLLATPSRTLSSYMNLLRRAVAHTRLGLARPLDDPLMRSEVEAEGITRTIRTFVETEELLSGLMDTVRK